MRPKKKPPRPSQANRRRSSSGSAADPESAAEDVAVTGRALVLSDRAEGASSVPSRLPLLPLRSDVVFPQTVVPLVVNRPGGIRLIDEVLASDKLIGLVTQRHPETEEPGMDDLYPTICVGSVLKMLKFPDGSTRIVCQGMFRARLVEVVQTEPFLLGRVEPLEDVVEEEDVEVEAQAHLVNRLFQRMVDQSQQVPE